MYLTREHKFVASKENFCTKLRITSHWEGYLDDAHLIVSASWSTTCVASAAIAGRTPRDGFLISHTGIF